MRHIQALLFALLFLAAITTRADTLNYNLTGLASQYCEPPGPYCGTQTLEFQIASNAVPESYTAISFTFGPDQFTFTSNNTFDTASPLTFYTDQTFNFGPSYGLNISCGTSNNLPLFSGATAHPTLLAGSSGPPYDFTNASAGCSDYPYESGLSGSLIITDISAPPNTSTPEPSTVLLLGTGILATAQAARRRWA